MKKEKPRRCGDVFKKLLFEKCSNEMEVQTKKFNKENLNKVNVNFFLFQSIKQKEEINKMLFNITYFYDRNYLGNRDFIQIPSLKDMIYNVSKYPVILVCKNYNDLLGITTLKYENNRSIFDNPYFPTKNENILIITGILTKLNNNYEKRIPVARENFRRSGAADRITLLEGDAQEVMCGLKGPFDFIFMDAAKGQYIHFLPEVMRLLAPGGVLISDNVLQDGDLIESHFAVERRNRTIYKRMREYLYELKHREDLVTSIIPLGDGITVSVKRTTEIKRETEDRI